MNGWAEYESPDEDKCQSNLMLSSAIYYLKPNKKSSQAEEVLKQEII